MVCVCVCAKQNQRMGWYFFECEAHMETVCQKVKLRVSLSDFTRSVG